MDKSKAAFPEQEWDYCVLGNGVSSLWVSHWLWSAKKSVLWITSEEPYSPERALLQHAWLWGAGAAAAERLTGQLQGFDSGEPLPPYEMVYFDARSSRRFRRWGEIKQVWGEQEKDCFQSALFLNPSELKDLWFWHSKLFQFHATENNPVGPHWKELFREPGYVRVQNCPITEIRTERSRIVSVCLSGLKNREAVEIRAKNFILGDTNENLPALIANENDAAALTNALKGKSYRAGFGLQLWHRELSNALNQVAVVPLTANPTEKSGMAHVAGRFMQTPQGLQSYWFGFLTDEEIEDNNEILKRIKQAKRALDRAIPGFAESILKESVSFEPRMLSVDLMKKRPKEVLGCPMVFDRFGLEAATKSVQSIFGEKIAGKESGEEKETETIWHPPAE